MPLIAVLGKHIRVILSKLEIVYYTGKVLVCTKKYTRYQMLINCKETFICNFFEYFFANIMGLLKILTRLTETGLAN